VGWGMYPPKKKDFSNVRRKFEKRSAQGPGSETNQSLKRLGWFQGLPHSEKEGHWGEGDRKSVGERNPWEAREKTGRKLKPPSMRWSYAKGKRDSAQEELRRNHKKWLDS